MKIPLLQSQAWQKLQEDLGEKSELITGKNYQFLAIVKSTPIGNYLYAPYGPVAEDKTAYNSAIRALKELATKFSAVFIRVEPQNPQFINPGTKGIKKSTDLNPKETWVLNLTGKDDELKSRLPSRLLRYHKSADKHGLTIETSQDPADIKHLLALQKSLADEKHINTFSEQYLKTELKQPFATLYLVKHQAEGSKSSEIVAAGLVFDDQTTRYNLQGAQNDTGRNLHATGILTIQLILDAKQKGLKTFDFWGIAPENAPKSHPWAGFTNFKKTFKGTEVDYAGTYDIVLEPLKYKFYQATRAINRVVRKV